MGETTEKLEIHRGLKGVYFDRSTFEETCYLLLKGELPARSQLDAFAAELKAARTLPAPVYDVIRTIKSAHPMDVLRTAVSALSAFDPETSDKSPEATLRKGIRLTAQVPMIIAAHEHIRNGREPVAPNPRLRH